MNRIVDIAGASLLLVFVGSARAGFGIEGERAEAAAQQLDALVNGSETNAGAVPGQAPIQKLPANPAEPAPRAGQEPESAPFTVDGGIDVTSAYFFRGYKIENRGLIVQPYGTLTWNAISNESVAVAPYVTTWNSLHSEVGEASDWQLWNESDVIAGLSINRGTLSLNLSYNLYTFPNGLTRQTEEIGIVLSYDDTGLMNRLFGEAAIGLNPHIGYYHEIHDRNGGEDTYLEIGIEPRYQLPNTRWSLAAPVMVGLSIDGFYTDGLGHNDPLGYASVGLKAGYAIDEHWSLNMALTYQRLESGSVINANDGARDALIATVGLGFSF